MKNRNFHILVILFLVFTNPIHSQSWNWSNPLPQGNNLNSSFFFSQQQGLVVGDAGTILFTTDNGVNWQKVTAPTYENLNSVCFPTVTTGYCVGRNGTVLKSTDGGFTWLAIPSGFNTNLNAVYFTSELTGYAVGDEGLICRTTDGGNSWNSQHWSNITFYSIHFPETNSGYIVGQDGLILKTIDGNTWIQQYYVGNYIYSLYFPSTLIGYAAGSSGIYKTTDGGQSWTKKSSGQLLHVHFINNTNGFAVGSDGLIMKTTDGGNTWETTQHNSSCALSSVFMTSSNSIFAFGYCGNILKTSNAGVTWQNISNASGLGFYGVHFPTPLIGYAIGGTMGHSLVYKTNNGGSSWEVLPFDPISTLLSTHFINADTGFITSETYYLFRTFNGGTTWDTVSLMMGPGESICFPNSDTGYVVGFGGQIRSTRDRGITWNTQNSNTTNNLRAVHFPSSKVGYISSWPGYGGDNVLVKTIDAGNTWFTIPCQYSASFSLFFTDDNTGYIIGGYGIMKTTDGGITWTNHPVPTQNMLLKIFFSTPNDGFAVGYNGTFLKTINAGESWELHPPMAYTTLDDIYFPIPTEGYIVGHNNTILKFSCINIQDPAGVIEGDTIVCPGQQAVQYTIPIIGGADYYVWTLPDGTVDTTQVNTLIINFSPFSQSGSLSVFGINLCSTGLTSSIFIQVQPLPVESGPITGLTEVCKGQKNVTYSVDTIQYAEEYIWTLPDGVIGNSNSNTITVEYTDAAISGLINVKGANSCGIGFKSTRYVNVKPLPGSVGPIYGPTSVCRTQGDLLYTVLDTPNTDSYIWVLPAGCNGDSFNNSILLAYSDTAQSGNLYITAENECGTSNTDSVWISVYGIPPTPVVSVINQILYSSAPIGNQWYVDNNMLPGDTNNYLSPTVTGDYHAIVTLSSCSSASSNIISNPLGIDIDYLNPNSVNCIALVINGILTLKSAYPDLFIKDIQLFNTEGKMLKTIQMNSRINEINLDIRNFPSQLFLIRLNTNMGVIYTRFIKV